MEIDKIVFFRAKIFGLFFTLLFLILLTRTFYIQAIEAPVLQEKAINIWNSFETIEPERGVIFDSNGDRLIHNTLAYTVIAVLSPDYPNHVTDVRKTARQLAPLLNMAEDTLLSLLTKSSYQVELRPGGWKVDKAVADQIKELNIPGIILKEEVKRSYPNNSFAAYVLGFRNYDNEAILGLEQYYDDILSGKPGQLNVLRDLKGFELPDSVEMFEPAEDGANLVLTIDKTIQQYVESALDRAETKYNPKKIVAIVADPKTGEILAMANRPNFNPNEYWTIQGYLNSAIQYQFEPGSTFKIVTLAAAIEEGVYNGGETYLSGQIKVPGGVIHDHNNGIGWGEISFLNGVQRSSNVAFVKLGYERLGKERLFSYISSFGYGQQTGIDLPGEIKGSLLEANAAYPLDVAAISIGQGIAVTPIQQVMAVAAVANGGKLLQPYIVKEIRDPDTGEVVIENKPVVKEQVISEETSRKATEVLQEVVEYGMEKGGSIPGYPIAGKTGTAQKIGEDGNYLPDKYVVSYIGYVTSQELLVYVLVDEPDLSIPYYGSTVAVPIFAEIMQNSLRYLKVPLKSGSESELEREESIILDNYLSRDLNTAAVALTEKGLNPVILGGGKTIIEQSPVAGTEVYRGATIYLLTEPRESLRIADFTGKSLREALELADVLGIEVKISGNGFVVKQSLPPGSIAPEGVIELILEPPVGVDSDKET